FVKLAYLNLLYLSLIVGLVRGFKSGILDNSQYLNLGKLSAQCEMCHCNLSQILFSKVQCENLDDIKLHLQSTDYGNFLANEASPLNVAVIDDKLREKLVA